jgi:hypothetical protein
MCWMVSDHTLMTGQWNPGNLSRKKEWLPRLLEQKLIILRQFSRAPGQIWRLFLPTDYCWMFTRFCVTAFKFLPTKLEVL